MNSSEFNSGSYSARPSVRGLSANTVLLGLSVFFSILAVIIAILAYRVASASLPAANASARQKYDFSSPEAAFKSHLTMLRDGDFAAGRSYELDFRRAVIEEQLKTLEVDRVAEYSGKRILFVKFQRRGIEQYDTITFERDAASGLWGQVNLFYLDVTDKQLGNEMSEWERKSRP